jgi:hypothetical protein
MATYLNVNLNILSFHGYDKGNICGLIIFEMASIILGRKDDPFEIKKIHAILRIIENKNFLFLHSHYSKRRNYVKYAAGMLKGIVTFGRRSTIESTNISS